MNDGIGWVGFLGLWWLEGFWVLVEGVVKASLVKSEVEM